MRENRAGNEFASIVKSNVRKCTREYRECEETAAARLNGADGGNPNIGAAVFLVPGTLAHAPGELPQPDQRGAARLRELDRSLAAIREAFPEVETDMRMCRQAAEILEGAWRERTQPVRPLPRSDEAPCTCAFCALLPTPPPRRPADYSWRRSDGPPLAVKIWPHRRETDSVLTGGWAWTRSVQDSDRDRGLRFRYEDDILVLHEYKRVETAIEIDRTREAIEEALTENYSINGARALVVGLFAAYKRSLDEYWIKLHAEGRVTLRQSTPFDIATYSLLQTMDSLFWHVPPNDELWQEETLATLVLCRVVDDMIDVRVDSLTGEIDNFWLSRIPSHEKTMLAACVIALMKYACMPESRSVLWNARLVSTTVVWMGLNGRHPLWFDGITSGSPAPADDCALCHLRPNPCIGLLTDGVSLRTAPQRLAENLGKSAARLSERCRVHCPQAWQLFHRELSSFEALHGTWKGDVEAMWEILRRTYIAAVEAWLAGGAGAREIQLDSAAVGAEMFHTLNQGTPTWQDNTALLSYLFGCAHPHFLWNGLGYAPGNLAGDWLDG